MNMNDDYLWDRTGEPDPEIEELERVMGTLRYQAPPLEIPAGVEPQRRTTTPHMMSPRWAVAAAIAVIVLGLGVWLSMQRRSTPGVAKTDTPPSPTRSADPETAKAPPVAPSSKDTSTEVAVNSEPPRRDVVRHPRSPRSPSNLAGRAIPRHDNASGSTQLTAKEFQDAQASKAQLMLALRVASTKVNFAVKKTQTPNPANQQNQHRIG